MALSVSSLGLGFAAGLVVGGLGAWLMRAPAAQADAVARADIVASERAHDDAEDDAEDDVESSGGVARNAAEPASTSAQLRDEVAKLREELKAERARREGVEGTPIPFPAVTAERHTEQGLMTAVRAALAELKRAGDVTAVDCSENPCLASVRVAGPVDVPKLEATAALKAYADDLPTVSASSFSEGDNVAIIGFSERVQFRVENDDLMREDKLEAVRAEQRAASERKGQRVRALFQAAIDARPVEPAAP